LLVLTSAYESIESSAKKATSKTLLFSQVLKE
jgi:hypothetical protein